MAVTPSVTLFPSSPGLLPQLSFFPSIIAHVILILLLYIVHLLPLTGELLESGELAAIHCYICSLYSAWDRAVFDKCVLNARVRWWFWNPTAWISVPALLSSSCVSLRKLLNFSVPEMTLSTMVMIVYRLQIKRLL